jgi:hypothetical protein
VPEPALGLAVVAAGVAVAALAASGPAIMAPTTPPVNSEPPTAAPTRNLLMGFIFSPPLSFAWASMEVPAFRNRDKTRTLSSVWLDADNVDEPWQKRR